MRRLPCLLALVTPLALLAGCDDSDEAFDAGPVIVIDAELPPDTAPPEDLPDAAPDAAPEPDMAPPDPGGLAVLGNGWHTIDKVTLEVIGTEADGLNVPRDLEFDPKNPDHLWTVNRAFDGTAMFSGVGTEDQTVDVRSDVFADHFMEEVAALSFGDNGDFATIHESRNTYNNVGFPNDFMGPTLWDADLQVYCAVNQDRNGGLLGSHIDMLHQSPLSMGIAHHKDNAYWVFDGLNGHIVYYDFKQDHGPGYDDHSDGVVRRYVEAAVLRVPNVPSHLYNDKSSGWLYIADTGNGRILRLDTKTGAVDGSFQPRAEPLVEYSRVRGVTVQVFVATGLTAPSGIAFHGGRLFVSDYATGDIVAYDLNGKEIDRLATGARGLMGITFGPEGKLYFVDGRDDLAVRVDP
ncbi:MAG: hypothetical protein KC416_08685 [Myxococcales bacterium]|nr:hypothetical protein [Myxococcales bacterium]